MVGEKASALTKYDLLREFPCLIPQEFVLGASGLKHVSAFSSTKEEESKGSMHIGLRKWIF
jgi:hypothetical protein